MLKKPSKQTVEFKTVKKFPMNETNFSEIDLADQNQDEYKHLRNTAAFIIEGVLLPILATFGIVGKSVQLFETNLLSCLWENQEREL